MINRSNHTKITDAGTFGSSGYGAKASEKLMKVRLVLCMEVRWWVYVWGIDSIQPLLKSIDRGIAHTIYTNKINTNQVRGKDFRHEKTKKKRGNYRGGTITLQSHSIKFDDSE